MPTILNHVPNSDKSTDQIESILTQLLGSDPTQDTEAWTKLLKIRTLEDFQSKSNFIEDLFGEGTLVRINAEIQKISHYGPTTVDKQIPYIISQLLKPLQYRGLNLFGAAMTNDKELMFKIQQIISLADLDDLEESKEIIQENYQNAITDWLNQQIQKGPLNKELEFAFRCIQLDQRYTFIALMNTSIQSITDIVTTVLVNDLFRGLNTALNAVSIIPTVLNELLTNKQISTEKEQKGLTGSLSVLIGEIADVRNFSINTIPLISGMTSVSQVDIGSVIPAVVNRPRENVRVTYRDGYITLSLNPNFTYVNWGETIVFRGGKSDSMMYIGKCPFRGNLIPQLVYPLVDRVVKHWQTQRRNEI